MLAVSSLAGDDGRQTHNGFSRLDVRFRLVMIIGLAKWTAVGQNQPNGSVQYRYGREQQKSLVLVCR